MGYSTDHVSTKLMNEIKNALANVSWGSVEVFVQDKKVTQITVRNIKKTSLTIGRESATQRESSDKKNSHMKNNIEVLTITE